MGRKVTVCIKVESEECQKLTQRVVIFDDEEREDLAIAEVMSGAFCSSIMFRSWLIKALEAFNRQTNDFLKADRR